VSGRRLVLALYVLSGACGLVYEIVWMRRLALTFGVTVFATSTVLAAFMAGLGLGSWLVARRIDESPNPVRVYAWLEIGIGLYALALQWIFPALEPLYVALAHLLEGHFLAFNLARGAVAFCVLLVPTTMMGGTVPAIGRYLVTTADAVGWNVGLLYAMNTLGAVLGCLAAGFVLVATLGMTGTTVLTAAANVGIGAAILLARVGGAPRTARREPVAAGDGPLPWLPVLVFAGSGFTALAYEVVWTRVMTVHVYNTTYAFSVMLAVFLAGLVLGDALLMRFYDRIRRPLLWLGAVEVLIGLSVVVAAAAYAPLHERPLEPQSWAWSLAVMVGRSALVLLPGAILFGLTFPLVARAVCLAVGRVGHDLGRAYAANTVGGILGSLGAGFVLVPAVGLRGTLLLLSAANIALGALCWLAAARGVGRAALAALALACLALPRPLIPRSIFFDALQIGPLHLIYYSEGMTDTTGVWESSLDGSRIVTYGDMRGTAGTGSNWRNRLQGHLAHLLHPAPARSLQIGFGVGNTLAAAALHPEVRQLDCVELSPQVRQTAAYFWTNDGVLANPKVHLIVDDGRNYLLRTTERYDVITLEPPDIYTAGVVNLYTEEFYRLAARALTDDGLICQWIPVGEMGDDEARMLVRAFQDVFPETTLWEHGRGGPLLAVGSKTPLSIDLERLRRRMREGAVGEDLVRLGLDDPDTLLGLFIAGPERTRAWVAGVPPVTDDRTVVDFSTPKALYSGFGFGYFRLQGERQKAALAHRASIMAGRDAMREPIAPWLTPRADGKSRP
jgi:spermidine synthase